MTAPAGAGRERKRARERAYYDIHREELREKAKAKRVEHGKENR